MAGETDSRRPSRPPGKRRSVQRRRRGPHPAPAGSAWWRAAQRDNGRSGRGREPPQRLCPSSPVQGGWSVQRNRLPWRGVQPPREPGQRLGGDGARACQPARAVGGPCVRASRRRSGRGAVFRNAETASRPVGRAESGMFRCRDRGRKCGRSAPRPVSDLPRSEVAGIRAGPVLIRRARRASPFFPGRRHCRRGGGFWLGRVRGAAGWSGAGRRVQGPAGAEPRRPAGRAAADLPPQAGIPRLRAGQAARAKPASAESQRAPEHRLSRRCPDNFRFRFRITWKRNIFRHRRHSGLDDSEPLGGRHIRGGAASRATNSGWNKAHPNPSFG